MTGNPSESPPETPAPGLAGSLAEAVGGTPVEINRTQKVRVEASAWREAAAAARDQFGLVFLSWLSATDWANQTAVGDPPDEEVAERYELLCAVSDLEAGDLVILSADLDKDSPRVDSISDIYPGANWHEREAAEMFGIDFAGHPDLSKLYLPEDFEGHPLRKSYPLLSREVKPWPGEVDVEDMPPAVENPEA